MPALRVRVIVDSDSPLPELPLTVRQTFSNQEAFDYQQVSGGGAVAIPITKIATPQAIVLTADQTVTVALGSITLGAGGFIVIVNGTPSTNPPTVTNASGNTTEVRGLGLG